ncbi:Smr/MutS family protein [Desulfonatronovibrio hydrogenovorans]|uniref:Smr/MutS family protein n=1 Tax=Desulfonatronovibrio hydrogenovorans TaxID=53245 RepID=UPI00048EBDCA|nr:Smr/MutS family protein [Desulfonatronovibrio hydrogenovorans]
MKSLQDLKKVKITRVKKNKDSKVVSDKKEKPPQTEDGIFFQAMQGVKPLNRRGRDVALSPVEQNIAQPEQDNSLEILNMLVSGEISFDVEYSDEYVQGVAQGINSKTLRKFKAGKLSIEAHLDLHGLNALQARLQLLNFMRDQYINSRKCLLLITGRGKNSPLGTPVLKNEVQSWLTREPLKRIVLAFCSAQPRHGGTGALYVLLRNFKKSGGKIFWERFTVDPEAD